MEAQEQTIEPQVQTEELGPIDVAVISFAPASPMTGEAVPILLDLVERGIIQVTRKEITLRDRRL